MDDSQDGSDSDLDIPIISVFWKDFRLEEKKSLLRHYELMIAENQKNSKKNGPDISEFTRDTDNEKYLLFKREVNNLTRRAKDAEDALLKISQELCEAPDPSAALASIAKKDFKLSELESENRKMRVKLEEFRKQPTHLEATIRRLQKRNQQLEQEDCNSIGNINTADFVGCAFGLNEYGDVVRDFEQSRLTPYGRQLLRSLLIEMGCVYQSNCVVGNVTEESVMVSSIAAKVILRGKNESLTLESFTADCKSFASLMDRLCKNKLPKDVKCLIEELQLLFSWSSCTWLPYHPATWQDSKIVGVFSYLRQIRLLHDDTARDQVDIALVKTWKRIAKQNGHYYTAGYWKELIQIPLAQNAILKELLDSMEHTQEELNTPAGFIHFARTVIIHFNDLQRKLRLKLERQHLKQEFTKQSPRRKQTYRRRWFEEKKVEDLAKFVWVMIPEFLSLFLTYLFKGTDGAEWQGRLIDNCDTKL